MINISLFSSVVSFSVLYCFLLGRVLAQTAVPSTFPSSSGGSITGFSYIGSFVVSNGPTGHDNSDSMRSCIQTCNSLFPSYAAYRCSTNGVLFTTINSMAYAYTYGQTLPATCLTYRDGFPDWQGTGHGACPEFGCYITAYVGLSSYFTGICNGINYCFGSGTSSPPSSYPSIAPSAIATSVVPSSVPSSLPSGFPSTRPTTSTPTVSMTPTSFPSVNPTYVPTSLPTQYPSYGPSSLPSSSPNSVSTMMPSGFPSTRPTRSPTSMLSDPPSSTPTGEPTLSPTNTKPPHGVHFPTRHPSARPSSIISLYPTLVPSKSPRIYPTIHPSNTRYPSSHSTIAPSRSVRPSSLPTSVPSFFSVPTPMPSIFGDTGPLIVFSPVANTTAGTMELNIRDDAMYQYGYANLTTDATLFTIGHMLPGSHAELLIFCSLHGFVTLDDAPSCFLQLPGAQIYQAPGGPDYLSDVGSHNIPGQGYILLKISNLPFMEGVKMVTSSLTIGTY